MASSDTRTFIVPLWAKVFYILRFISIFHIIRLILKDKITYVFVDAWVLGNLIASILSVLFVRYTQLNFFWYCILIYSFLRIFEIVVYQINVLLFDEYRARNTNNEYSLRSHRRIVLLLLHNYFEIVFWFAASYLVLANEFTFENMKEPLVSILYASFIVMTNYGSQSVKPETAVGLYILWAQSITGLFMTLLSLARFIALLPVPGTMEKDESRKK